MTITYKMNATCVITIICDAINHRINEIPPATSELTKNIQNNNYFLKTKILYPEKNYNIIKIQINSQTTM